MVVALAPGGPAFALLQGEGLAALSGQRAVARAGSCGTGRQHSCYGRVRSPSGETLDEDAGLPNSGASEGDVLAVRYRAGLASPTASGGRFSPLMLATLFGVGSAVALAAAVASAVGRGPRQSRG